MPSTGGLVNTSSMLHPDFVSGVFASYIPDEKQYILGPYFPDEMLQTNNVKWDEVSPMNYGMTYPVAPMAESPIIQGGSMRQFEVEPAHFREKYVLREDEVTAMRQLGTASDVASVADRIADILLWGRGRIQDRFEKMRWDLLDGLITISQNNVNISVPFNLPAYLNVALAGPDLWTAPATAQPIKNIMDMVNKTRGYGFQYSLMVMNHTTANIALQIQEFKNLFSGAVQGGALNANLRTMDTLGRILQMNVPGMPDILEFNGQWRDVQPLTADAAITATSATLDDVTNFAIGQQVTFVSKNTIDEQLVTLTAVDPVAKTIDFTGDPLTAAYVAGSWVRLAQPYVKDGVIFFLPQRGGPVPSIGKTFMTPTPQGGSLDNPKPGPFALANDFPLQDPPRRELIFGASGLPVPVYRNTWAKLTVF